MRAWTCVACLHSLKVRVPCGLRYAVLLGNRPLADAYWPVGAAITVYDDLENGVPVNKSTIGMTKIASLGLRNIILELNVACKRSG
jgi:hypothetical protein